MAGVESSEVWYHAQQFGGMVSFVAAEPVLKVKAPSMVVNMDSTWLAK